MRSPPTSDRPLPLTPDEVVRQLRHIPSAPRVLPQIKRLLSDGNSSVHEVEALILLDPGLAARVLQMGNSAYYGSGLRCHTIEAAVQRVGYDQIYRLVAHAAASQVLVRPLAVYGLEVDELWERSIGCALAAEAIAGRLELEGDLSYTIGLLHGAGLVAINEWATRRHPELYFPPTSGPMETSLLERQALGFDHAEAGAALLRQWEFPPATSEPIRWQYLPAGGGASHRRLATILHLAKFLQRGLAGGALEPGPQEGNCLAQLGLTHADLDSLLATVAGRLESIRTQLDVDFSEHAVLEFPNGRRTIEGVGAVRRDG